MAIVLLVLMSSVLVLCRYLTTRKVAGPAGPERTMLKGTTYEARLEPDGRRGLINSPNGIDAATLSIGTMLITM